jgi:rubrerythrin
MSLTQAFQALERLEQAMAGFYERLAQVHAGDAEAARLFTRLAIEEHAHAREVALQRRLTMQISEPDFPAAVDPADILRVLEEVGVAAGAIPRISLDKALDLAAAFESSAAEAHYRGILSGIDTGMSRLVTALGHGDRDHRARLVSFAAARGIALP